MNVRWFFLILCWPMLVSAQEFRQGKAQTGDRKFQPVSILGPCYDKVCLVKGLTDDAGLLSDVLIELYDTNQLSRAHQVTFEGCFADKQRFFPEAVMCYQNRLLVLGSSYDKEQKSNVLLVKQPDLFASSPNLDPGKELMRVPTAFFSNGERRFHTTISSNGDNLLALTAGYPLLSDSMQICFQVFGPGFTVLKTFKQLIPSAAHRFQVVQTEVDNSGNVLMLVDWYSEGKNASHAYSLYAFPVMSDEVLEFALDLPGMSLRDLRMLTNTNDRIVLSGLFYKGSSVDSKLPEGFFFTRIDRETGNIELLNKYTFYDLGTQLPELKASGKSFDEIAATMRLTELRLSPGGKARIVLEQQAAEEICQTDFRSNMMVCNQHYYINNLLVLGIDNEGKIDETTWIEKSQHLIENERVYLSCFMFDQLENDYRILFNTNQKERDNALRLTFPERSQIMSFPKSGRAKPIENEIPVNIEAGFLAWKGAYYLVVDGRDGTAISKYKP